MIVAPPKRPTRSEENILPLINIVFLLLIFFMLAGTLNTRAPFEWGEFRGGAFNTPAVAYEVPEADLGHRALVAKDEVGLFVELIADVQHIYDTGGAPIEFVE